MALLRAAGAEVPVQAILFDKDGTLLDFVYTWGNWSEQLLARFSHELEARKLRPIEVDSDTLWGTRRSADGEIRDYDRNGPLAMGTVGELLAVLTWQGYRSGLSWAEAKVLARECATYANERLAQARTVKPLEGVAAFLAQCRRAGLALGVVTADETETALEHLDWLGFGHYFDVCVGADQTERGKPFPDMVELACGKLGLPCSRVAVIGDTNGDMRMAKAAGAALAIGIAGPAGADAELLADADAMIVAYGELAVLEGES
ncbi:phosphoglycolate phosphatase [Paenibacillus sp. UNC496MF]|uniref:HAD family hydrolase n=1 Tax=Paenibacillus sp. UNC496MF TaxID=1502753 RepID=UPI0008E140AB|nr:HAD-IA family hydrolase [Paenibacillus sp. UNC496MF]SFJ40666.1 phosphoglycolate phosphatase [Paenibacillus sp. UNC496MF]